MVKHELHFPIPSDILGIGAAMAVECAKYGSKVIISARRETLLGINLMLTFHMY